MAWNSYRICDREYQQEAWYSIEEGPEGLFGVSYTYRGDVWLVTQFRYSKEQAYALAWEFANLAMGIIMAET